MPRRLRIAVSVLFALLAVAFAVLWIRSYAFLDSRVVLERGGKVFIVQSLRGQLSVFSHPSLSTQWFKMEPTHFRIGREVDQMLPTIYMSNMVTTLGSSTREAVIPYWTLASACAVGAALSFPVVRFSLRTLLIATTLIALTLGAIVWSIR